MRIANSLQSWRQAATLIVAAKSKTKSPLTVTVTGLPLPAAQTGSRPSHAVQYARGIPKTDYRVLSLKRNSTQRFLPNAHVFPGGAIAASDFSDGWADLFKSVHPFLTVHDHNKAADEVTRLRTRDEPTTVRPPILTADYGFRLANDIAFRICAIRETFEETGILICKLFNSVSGHPNNTTDNDVAHHMQVSTGLASAASPDPALSDWRTKVMRDDSQFLLMCQTLNIVPDIWALYEWSDWLTPARLAIQDNPAKRRYDTMFYICCLSEQLVAEHDGQEIDATQVPNWYQITYYYIYSRKILVDMIDLKKNGFTLQVL